MIQRCWWHRTSLRQPTAVANGHKNYGSKATEIGITPPNGGNPFKFRQNLSRQKT